MNAKRLILAVTILLFLANSARSFNVDGIEYTLIENGMAAQVSHSSEYGSIINLTIPDSVIYNGQRYPVIAVGNSTFTECENLKTVNLGSKLKSILMYAFAFCDSINEIIIPDNVEYIDYAAFLSCRNLEKIVIGKSVSSLYINAFMFCPTKHVVWNAKDIRDYEVNEDTKEDEYIHMWDNAPSIETLEFGSEVESIPTMIAAESKIKTITIPQSVKAIYSYAFQNCKQLKEIKVEKDNPADIVLHEGVFMGVDKDECVLIVPKGSAELYRQAAQWNEFANIREVTESPWRKYDLNGDGLVDVEDVNALINTILSQQ